MCSKIIVFIRRLTDSTRYLRYSTGYHDGIVLQQGAYDLRPQKSSGSTLYVHR